MCPAPTPRTALVALTPLKPKKLSSKGKEKSRAACQVVEVLPQNSEGEGTLAAEHLQRNLYENNSKGEDNPMVSETTSPLLAQVEIGVPHSGVKG